MKVQETVDKFFQHKGFPDVLGGLMDHTYLSKLLKWMVNNTTTEKNSQL